MSTHAFSSPFRPYNPFLDPAVDVAEVADAHEPSYALVASGPAVSSEETESHLDAVEVKVRWGTQVLSVAHLETGKGFAVGDSGDFVLPDSPRMQIVESRGGKSYVIVPSDAKATVSRKGEHPRAANGGEEIALTEGTSITIE
ncbi:MAG TPA: hypothetical protein VM580_07030, partial [Labilithrix sp.]|nr:hypothetical protein [Labilithrix sp.]